MTIATTKWDSAEYLDTPEAVAAYLEAVFEDGDPRLVAHALGVVARSTGMSKLSKETGLTRAGLYKALSEDGDPRLTTLLGVLKSLGLALSVHPVQPAE